jgi:hypothetical protein
VLEVGVSNRSFTVTPLRYAGHSAIDRFLGLEEAHRLVEETAQVNEETVI